MVMDGDLVSELVISSEPKIQLTAKQLQSLLKQTADEAVSLAYDLAEAQRQRFQHTPDGLLDKTIDSYNLAEPNTVPLLEVEGTGTEVWHETREDDNFIPQKSQMNDHIDSIVFKLIATHPGMPLEEAYKLSGLNKVEYNSEAPKFISD